jgi:hypothetical protein
MRKLKFSITALLAVTTGLAGCNLFKKDDKKEDAEVTVSKLTLASSFRTAYKVDETIPWSEFSVTATYSDKSNKTFTGNKIEFDVETAKAETELVVFTEGLHAQSTLEEGSYNVKAAVASDLTKKFDLARFVIGTVTADKYDLVSFAEPENIVRHKQAKAAGGEGAFVSTDEAFTVGTLNVFKYEPIALFRNKETRAVEASTNYEKAYSLREINGESRTDVEFATYAEVKNHELKFKPAAEGKSFELNVGLKEFASALGGGAAKLSLDVKVEKGLNVYSAKEIGALNLTRYTQADYDLPASRYVAHRGVYNDNGVYDVYWNEETSSPTSCDTTALWKSFLAESGTFTAEELVAYQDLPAIFLQDNLTIEKEDIPAKYFIQGQEGQTVDTDGDGHYDCEGTIRDDVDIYTPMVGEHDVVINGNFFSLGSKLGFSRVCRDNFVYYHDSYNPSALNGFQPGHSTLIKFCGLFPTSTEGDARVNYFKNQVDLSNGKVGVIKNLDANGYSSADFSPDSGDANLMSSMGSLIFVKNQFCGASYENNVIKQFQIGLFADEMVQGAREHAGAHNSAEVLRYNTLIKGTKVFDCPNSAICNFHNGGVVVETSTFKRYGGAPLLSLGYKADSGDISEGAGDADRKAVTVFTSDCEFSNMITSEETYYKAVGASGFLPLLQAYERFLLHLGNSIMFKEDGTPVKTEEEISVGKMNLYTLAMDGSAMLSQNYDHNSDVILGFDSPAGDGYLEGMCNGGAQYAAYAGLAGMIGTHAPVFATDKEEDGMFCSLYSEMFPTAEFSQLANPFAAYTQHLEGSKISFMLPVDNPDANIHTTLVATFQLVSIAE